MRRIRAVSFAVAAAMLIGCGSDKATDPGAQAPTTVSGVFVLQTVNAKPLPYSFTDPEAGSGVVFAITSDQITLRQDGTFAEVMVMTMTQGGQPAGSLTLPSNGTYVYTASTHAISLLASGGARVTGTVSNDTMTLKDDSDTLVFRRQ
jgi:VCBS repeat-containing protein